MITRRRIGIVLAIAILAAGVGLAQARTLTVPAVVFQGVGLLLLVLGCVAVFHRLATDRDPIEMPDPELPRRVRMPGAEFDQQLTTKVQSYRDRETYTQQRIRKRLQSVATSILTVYGGLSADAVAAHIQTGTWTQNRTAAAFLAEGSLPSPSLSTRLLNRGGQSSSFVTGVRETVHALIDYTGTPPRQDHQSTWSRVRPALRGAQQSPQPWSDWTADATPSSAGQDTGQPSRRLTHHWRGIAALALGSLGFGILFEEPALVLVCTIGVGYVAFARVRTLPPVTVSISHALSESNPPPGDEVTVTVTVRNDGPQVLSDLRIVDGVPVDLAVVEGSPRHATVLPPDASVSFEYSIRARRGRHPFIPVEVRTRSLADTVETTTRIETDTCLVSQPPLTPTAAPALRDAVSQYVGQIPTTQGGTGVEFHSTREYRHGDPVTRIDWKRLARSRELATIAYREERAAEVVLVVDTRAAAYVSPEAYEPHACDRSCSAAGMLFEPLRAMGNRVGLASFGPESYWLAPTARRDARHRMRSCLTEHPAFSQRPPDRECYVGDWVDEFRQRFTGPVQVMLLSPVCDATPVRLARRLEAHGYPVTAICPDPTSTATSGQQLAHLERRARLYDLRRAGATVVDWRWENSLAAALARDQRRWSG